ncbi:MAG: hypothetical protein ABI824_02470 [Acidobacteriota bacterium]
MFSRRHLDRALDCSRSSLLAIACLLVAITAGATTLVQLSMTQMIQQSTAIVRARVTGSYAADRNGQIYTHYQLQILETLKGTATSDVAVPGGVLHGTRQLVAGAPELSSGQEYVLFLWTSKSGLTQLIGLSQGSFDVVTDATGNAQLARGVSATVPGAVVMDAGGQPVARNGQGATGSSEATSLSLVDLRSTVQQVLGGGK